MPNNYQQQISSDEEPQRLAALLKSTRLAQGKTLAQISEATGISIPKLQAMEEEDRENLPAKVFVRGFIRLYVKQLDLDPQNALQMFADEWTGDSGNYLDSDMPYPKPGNSFSLIKVMSISLTLIILCGALYLVFSNYIATKDTLTLQDETIIEPPEQIPEPILPEDTPIITANTAEEKEAQTAASETQVREETQTNDQVSLPNATNIPQPAAGSETVTPQKTVKE